VVDCPVELETEALGQKERLWKGSGGKGVSATAHRSLNPSSAAAHYWGALIHASSGNFAAVTAQANRALRLSPFDPPAFVPHTALGHVAVVEGHYDEAASHCAWVFRATGSSHQLQPCSDSPVFRVSTGTSPTLPMAADKG
jgi:hypothetical protein